MSRQGFKAPADLGRRHVMVGAVALVVAACSSGPVPRDNFYRLGAPAPLPPLAGGPIQGILEVPPFRTEGVVGERAILYRDGPRELAQYSYHAWLEPPGVMLQNAFVGALRDTQSFRTVATPDMRLDRDYELLANVHQLEHVIADQQAKAAVEIEINIRRVRDNQLVLSKTYRAAVPCATDSVDAFAEAVTKGLDMMFSQFLADLASVPKALPAAGG